MSAPAPVALLQIDQDIIMAAAGVRYARRRQEHSPNPETIQATDDAEAWLNELLERRFAAQQAMA